MKVTPTLHYADETSSLGAEISGQRQSVRLQTGTQFNHLYFSMYKSVGVKQISSNL